MTQTSTPDIADASQAQAPVASRTKQMVMICIWVAVFRFYQLWIERSSIASWQQGLTPTWAYWTFIPLAIVAAAVGARIAARSYGHLVSFLYGVLFGVGFSLPIGAIPGIFFGGFASSLAAFPRWRRVTFSAARSLARIGGIAFFAAAIVGFAISTRRGIWAQSTVLWCMAVCSLLLIVFALINAWRCCRPILPIREQTKESPGGVFSLSLAQVAWGLSKLCFCVACGLFFLFAGWIVGLELDNYRVRRQIDSGLWYIAGASPVSEWPICGITGSTGNARTWILESATDEQLRLVRRYDDIVNLLCTFGPEVTQSGTAHLGKLPISYLSLFTSNDELNSFIRDFSQLVELDLGHSRTMTDATVKYLNCPRSLSTLILNGTNITDASLEHLTDYSVLQRLEFAGTSITDAGLATLPTNAITTLNLENTKITAKSIFTLSAMPELHTLNVGGTAIAATDLKNLKGLPNLYDLTLIGQKVGMEEANLLLELGLMSLTIRDCGVDDATAKRIAARGFPFLNIDAWNLSPATAKLLKPDESTECFFSVDNKQVTKADMQRLLSLKMSMTFRTCTFDRDALQLLADDIEHEPFFIWDLECDGELSERLSLSGVTLEHSPK
ncbi:MAG: hypothetical protein KDB27_17860 [Planctomycetales bacterium]|nr:hypothetical protein [Planctomycetales bacterium]